MPEKITTLSFCDLGAKTTQIGAIGVTLALFRGKHIFLFVLGTVAICLRCLLHSKNRAEELLTALCD